METIHVDDKTITFIPTAHVSAESALEVKQAIESLKPEQVCIELDAQRANALMHPQEYKNTDIIQVIRTKKVGLFAVNLLLSSYQKRLAKKLNVSVGSEMQAAITSAQEVNASIAYIDRDIQITFKRIMNSLSFIEKIKLFLSFFSDDDESAITSEDIEAMKEQDVLESALSAMSSEFPSIKRILLDERNAIMADAIRKSPAKTLVVVIGAAHFEGIKQDIYEPKDISTLNTIPPKKTISKIVPWIIPSLLVVMIVALAIANGSRGLASFGTWMITSTVLATLGAVVTFSHPVTILVTFLTTWIGALSPFLAVGWFAGLSEAYFRKPKVKDFDTLFDDLGSFKTARKNAVIHIILVIFMTNVLSSIGTLVAGLSIVQAFFNLF